MARGSEIEGVPGPGRIGRIAIGDILQRAAARFPDRVALVDAGRHTSYRDLDESANRCAHYFRSRGLRPGDKVSTICSNSAAFVAVMFAIHKAGLVWVPMNTMLSRDDMSYILDHAGVSLVVIDDELYAQADRSAMLAELGLAFVIHPLAGLDLDPQLPKLDQALADQPAEAPDVDIDERDLALIMYTSGTTSRPKGVMHSHVSVVFAAMSNAIEWGYGRDEAATGVLPLFHCGQQIALLTLFVVGGKLALQRGFDAEVMMQTIERERLTVIVGLPLMYEAMLNHPDRGRYDLGSIRKCIYAMAPMGKPLITRLVHEFCPNFYMLGGQTEMYPCTAVAQPERQLVRFGNYWGETTLMNETAIMDEAGHILPRGEAGEIVHRGPNVMMGYYKNAEATAESRQFGWHHTGDLGLIDPHGELLFLDRKKDMIKTGGENVPSMKIEEALLAHPAVLTAAAVGLPHPRWGEAIAAIVTLKPGATASEELIIGHCKTLLGGFQVPKVALIIDALPMTSTGKIRKAELRAQFADYFAHG